MKSIWKYVLHEQLGNIDMPIGAKILSVGWQANSICMWVEVDIEPISMGQFTVHSNITTESRQFAIYGTGHEILTEKRAFIGTVNAGMFVWHIYEVLP